MKVAGIIAEYNPFHSGHAYHLEKTRQTTGADYIVAVMSGDFVQRGEPALLDKYVRTRMALLGGADLVLELPVLFACGSAGDFAAGGVSLLDKLGVVDCLSFGSECGQTGPFEDAADALAKEPPELSEAIQSHLRSGLSYPKARAMALAAKCPFLPKDFLSAPNNILGLEYVVALRRRASAIRPVALRREGMSYLDRDWGPDSASFPSALALRRLLLTASDDLRSRLRPAVLSDQWELWENLLSKDSFLSSSDFTKELRYRLLTDTADDLTYYADVSRELSHKIKKKRMRFSDWEDLCGLLKSKELTYSRISRALCHILLSVDAQSQKTARENDYVPYARILGFRKTARPLLTCIRQNASLPLVSKLADAVKTLEGFPARLLQQDILAADLYESALAARQNRPMRSEISRELILLPDEL